MPQSKDLSFNARKATREQAIKQRVADINAEFKLIGVLPRMGVDKNCLYIRYMDDRGNRRKISPKGVDLSPLGIRYAQDVCDKISQALRLGNYSDEWLQREIYKKVEKERKLTVGMVTEEFSSRWIKYRSGDRESTSRQKQRTLGYYEGYMKRMIADGSVNPSSEFTPAMIKKLLDLYLEGTDRKFRARETLSVICTIFGITYNFKGIGKRAKSKRREIPTDSDILAMFEKFDNLKRRFKPEVRDFYKMAFATIATYGLRPQELFAIDMQKSFRPETSYWIILDGKFCDGIKTGNRAAPPLMPEWVELFGIKPFAYLPTSINDWERLANRTNEFFLRHDIGCKPYDLRHAYAIRGDKLGKSVVKMARQMGHDVSTHIKIYQRWMSIEDQIESFNNE